MSDGAYLLVSGRLPGPHLSVTRFNGTPALVRRPPPDLDHRRAVVVQSDILQAIPTFRRDSDADGGVSREHSLDEAVHAATLRVLAGRTRGSSRGSYAGVRRRTARGGPGQPSDVSQPTRALRAHHASRRCRVPPVPAVPVRPARLHRPASAAGGISAARVDGQYPRARAAPHARRALLAVVRTPRPRAEAVPRPHLVSGAMVIRFAPPARRSPAPGGRRAHRVHPVALPLAYRDVRASRGAGAPECGSPP